MIEAKWHVWANVGKQSVWEEYTYKRIHALELVRKGHHNLDISTVALERLPKGNLYGVTYPRENVDKKWYKGKGD